MHSVEKIFAELIFIDLLVNFRPLAFTNSNTQNGLAECRLEAGVKKYFVLQVLRARARLLCVRYNLLINAHTHTHTKNALFYYSNFGGTLHACGSTNTTFLIFLEEH